MFVYQERNKLSLSMHTQARLQNNMCREIRLLN